MTSSGQKKNWPLLAYACVYLAFIYIPVLLLPVFSVNDSLYIAFPLKGFTLKWYESMLTNDSMHRALWNSIKVALAAATISTVLGIFAAKAVTRYRMPGQKSVVSVIMLPLVIPEIILGTSLLILVTQIGIGLSLFSVVMGHVLINVPFAMAVLISRFEGFDQALEEASSDLGEGARGLKPTALTALVRSIRATGFSLWASVCSWGWKNMKFWCRRRDSMGWVSGNTNYSQIVSKHRGFNHPMEIPNTI